MTRRRLDWLLRARGTDLAAWPERERHAALVLLRRSRAARQSLADLMAGDNTPEPDSAAVCRMQLALRHALAPRPVLVRGIGWSALAACAAAGLYVGIGTAEPDIATPDLFTQAQTVSFASLDQ
jgi:hypothetical protein